MPDRPCSSRAALAPDMELAPMMGKKYVHKPEIKPHQRVQAGVSKAYPMQRPHKSLNM